MKRADRSSFAIDRAARARTSIILATLSGALISTSSAFADVPPSPDHLVVIPARCVQFWTFPDGTGSPAQWSQALSFAACIQDTSVAPIERADQVPGFVDQLHAALAPSVDIYVAAIERGPEPVNVRAAYLLGMTYVALITRARSSIVAPKNLFTNAEAAARHHELHAELEPTLQRTAQLAWILFTAIDRVTTDDPALAPDVVTRNMARSARQLADVLGRSWSVPRDEPEASPVLAFPR